VRSFTLANLLRLLLGLWVLDAPFINAEFARETIIVWNQIVVGGFVVALAAMRMVFVREAGIFRWAHVALGLWMAASPWILDYVEDEAAFWNSLVSGVLITILAAWSLVR
jgi:hypothetical protein